MFGIKIQIELRKCELDYHIDLLHIAYSFNILNILNMHVMLETFNFNLRHEVLTHV
jgi:hypothetical protein